VQQKEIQALVSKLVLDFYGVFLILTYPSASQGWITIVTTVWVSHWNSFGM